MDNLWLNRYPESGRGLQVRYSPFGGGGGGKPPPQPAPIPRKVEIDVEAAKKEELDLAARRRGRLSTILSRGLNTGIAETNKSSLLGV